MKRCSQCGLKRHRGSFTKDKRNPDGLCDICKYCKQPYEREYKKLRRSGKLTKSCNVVGAGIDSWGQINSVLRELSELQFRINTENGLCQKRKAMIEKYLQEMIEPFINHQTGLQAMLIGFLKNNRAEAKQVKVFRFGSVCFQRGRLKLELKPALAGRRLGKP